MSKQGKRDIDVTHLINQDIPTEWRCPHCRKKNQTGLHASEILIEHKKYLESCDYCGYVHCWELELTDDFIQKTVNAIINGEV